MDSVSAMGLVKDRRSVNAPSVSGIAKPAGGMALSGRELDIVRFSGKDEKGSSWLVTWLKQYIYQPLLTAWEKLKTWLSSPFKWWASKKRVTPNDSVTDSSAKSDTSTAIETRPGPPPVRDVQAPNQASRSPLSIDTLFGSDLSKITFKQRGGNTCYLLASLDAIFHHPQGKRLLEKIQFSENNHSYFVKFPGQPAPVEVRKRELGTLRLPSGRTLNGAETQCLGVQLIESAYSRLPSHVERHENGRTYTEGFGKFFSPGHCLTQLFGPQNVTSPSGEHKNALLVNARAVQLNNPDFADIWVAQKVGTTANSKPVEHYNSVICHQKGTPGYFEVLDPFVPKSRYVGPVDDIVKRYVPTSVRIQLNS